MCGVLVLLAGEAGLRLGEIVALEWRDIDLVSRRVCVERAAWKGQIGSPKGGRLRHVFLTQRLAAALRIIDTFRDREYSITMTVRH